jgi:hypothetical protein
MLKIMLTIAAIPINRSSSAMMKGSEGGRRLSPRHRQHCNGEISSIHAGAVTVSRLSVRRAPPGISAKSHGTWESSNDRHVFLK